MFSEEHSHESFRRGDDRMVYWARLLEVVADCVSNNACLFIQFNRAQLRRTDFLVNLFHVSFYKI